MAGRINWLRVIITFTLSVLAIFLPIRRLKMNKIYKRVPKYRSGSQACGPGPPEAPSPFNRAAGPEQLVRAASRLRMPSMCERLCGNMRPMSGGGGIGNQFQRQTGPRTSNVTYEYELVEAKSALAPLETFLKFYYKFFIYYSWWLLFKHLVVCILRIEALARFRYLDCYLVGRFIVNGRVIELACYCACFLITYYLSWFYSIRSKNEGDFKLSCFEFMLVGQEKVAGWARRTSTRVSVRSENTLREEEDEENVSKSERDDQSDRLHSSIFEFQNPFESNNHTKCYGLRPNRTPECWHSLARVTLGYYRVFGLIMVMLTIFFLGMVLPVSLNQKGFEYNYRYCIHYITTQRIKASQDAGYPQPSWPESYLFNLIRHNQDEMGGSLGKVLFSISRPNVTRKFRLSSKMGEDFLQPIKNVVHMNPYHATRVFLDIFDSSFIYFQIAFALNCACFMIVLLCRDIVHYCSVLNIRLSSLIVALRSTSTINLKVPENYYYESSIKYNDRLTVTKLTDDQRPGPQLSTRALRLIRADIHECQAMIADMFTMIDSYNKYISHQMVCLVLFWLGYSALVSSWLFIPGNDSPKTEWFTLHVCATIYLFILMYQFSAVKSECRHLYRRIVIAMAFDEFNGTSKITWTSLLKFYTPVPMFCFTMIKSVELNMMFGLKLLAWLFSALIVASSFFTVYRID